MRQTKIYNYNKKYSFLKSLLNYKKNSIFHKVYYALISYPFFYKHKKMLKYIILGLPGTFVDFLLLYLLTGVLGVFYLISASISTFCGIIVSFFLQRKFTFKFKSFKFSSNIYTFLGFISISLSSIFFTNIFMLVFIGILGINYLIGKIMSDLLLLFYKYFGHSFTFKFKSKRGL